MDEAKRAEVLSFINQAVLASRERKTKPKQPQEAAAPLPKLMSSRWIDERVVYLVTTTHCACGAVHSQTNPHPMLRRFHPLWGIHEEAISLAPGIASRSILPISLEQRNISIRNCHECLGPADINPYTQLDLFHQPETFNGSHV